MLRATPAGPPPGREVLRHFGLLAGLALIVLPGLLLPWLLKRHYPKWPWAAGGLLMVGALIAPNTLRIIYTPWTWLARLFNRLTRTLIVAAAFLFVITPVAWIMRLFGNDPMARRFDRDAPTYRVPSRSSHPSTMERPF